MYLMHHTLIVRLAWAPYILRPMAWVTMCIGMMEGPVPKEGDRNVGATINLTHR